MLSVPCRVQLQATARGWVRAMPRCHSKSSLSVPCPQGTRTVRVDLVDKLGGIKVRRIKHVCLALKRRGQHNRLRWWCCCWRVLLLLVGW